MSRVSETNALLKKLIAQGIDQAIRRLEEIISSESSLYNTFIQLKSRYSAYLNAIILGTVSQKELDGHYAKLSHSLILLVDGLKESDLKPETVTISSAYTPRKGELLYHIPRQMQERSEHRCSVRLAYLKDLLYKNWEVQDTDIQKSIRIAEVMSVELISLDETEPFSIRSLHSTIQFLEENDFTEWVFLVKPKQIGEFNLALRVSMIEVRQGREVKKDVVFEEHVIVSTESPNSENSSKFTKSDLQFDFVSSIPIGTPTEVNQSKSPTLSKVLRATALALVIGMVATYSLTPSETRDWWVTSNMQNTPKSYESFLAKYPQSRHAEEALYLKSITSQQPSDFLAYQEQYPEGRFQKTVSEKLELLETERFQEIEKNPTEENVSQFLADFPNTMRLYELELIVGADLDLLAIIEESPLYGNGIMLPDLDVVVGYTSSPPPTCSNLNNTYVISGTGQVTFLWTPDDLFELRFSKQGINEKKIRLKTEASAFKGLPGTIRVYNSNNYTCLDNLAMQNPWGNGVSNTKILQVTISSLWDCSITGTDNQILGFTRQVNVVGPRGWAITVWK